MPSKEQLKQTSDRLRKSQAGLYSMAQQIESIVNMSTEKLTDDQTTEIEALMDNIDESYELHNPLLIELRDKIRGTEKKD